MLSSFFFFPFFFHYFMFHIPEMILTKRNISSITLLPFHVILGPLSAQFLESFNLYFQPRFPLRQLSQLSSTNAINHFCTEQKLKRGYFTENLYYANLPSQESFLIIITNTSATRTFLFCVCFPYTNDQSHSPHCWTSNEKVSSVFKSQFVSR